MKKDLVGIIFGRKLRKQQEAQKPLYARHLMWKHQDQIESFFGTVSESTQVATLNWTAEEKAQVKVNEIIYGKKDLRLHIFPRLKQELQAWRKHYRKIQNQFFPKYLLIAFKSNIYDKKARLTHPFFGGDLFLIKFKLKYFSHVNMGAFPARFSGKKVIKAMYEQQKRRFQPFCNNELYLSAFHKAGNRALLSVPIPAFLAAVPRRRELTL